MCEECDKTKLPTNPEHDYKEEVIKFYEIREGVGVVIQPMTKKEARTLFLYRPFSKYAESRFGGNVLVDDMALLINELATLCRMCAAPTKNMYLINGTCPDCDGRSERNGKNPRKK